MTVLLLHPELPSCDDCREYLYSSDWKLERRPKPDGPPIKRPKISRPPCATCPKIPKPYPPGETAKTVWWGMAAELTPRNWQVYQHYLECRAVGWQVPDAGDPLVRRHAAIIRAVEDEAGRVRDGGVLSSILGSRRKKES